MLFCTHIDVVARSTSATVKQMVAQDGKPIESPVHRMHAAEPHGGGDTVIPEMYEQDEMPQMRQHGSAGSLIDVEGQLYRKPAGLRRLDENVENE